MGEHANVKEPSANVVVPIRAGGGVIPNQNISIWDGLICGFVNNKS